ncbi:MAG: 50S ribosomal protein L6 [Anaerolineae bacterium]|nr:50S ribosomal protein L6 [Anaerolineae bacterium]MDH7473500.1 50S ribosomal protein L6 [Anaerolineae bacterium]
MSRIGRMPIPVPKGVQVNIEKNRITVRGPRGELTRTFHPDMMVTLQDGHLVVTRPTDQRHHRALHGLTRALLANMVTGVSQGFRKVLQVEGVGYRAELQGNTLVLNVGFSHPVEFKPPAGITFQVEQKTKLITVEGVDKELVGEVAARIRKVRPPEPYKGKGIRYQDEHIRRKAGKAGKVGM